MPKEVPQNTAKGIETNLIDLGLDLITDAITGVSIPKPIKQNAFKAFGRLCSAAIEVPAVYFEGIVE
jgi:NAD(P)H-hydrate repair Nnr-like enzyme with NAD(P)H-hydrate epimerase domain